MRFKVVILPRMSKLIAGYSRWRQLYLPIRRSSARARMFIQLEPVRRRRLPFRMKKEEPPIVTIALLLDLKWPAAFELLNGASHRRSS
jgi:hypothetical protein